MKDCEQCFRIEKTSVVVLVGTMDMNQGPDKEAEQ